MLYKFIFLICIGLLCIVFYFLFFKNIIHKRIKIKFKNKLKTELKKEQERQQQLFAIDKANKDSESKDKIFMEKRKLKAINDPNFDLFYDEEKVLHKQRLEFKNKSKWKGKIHYRSNKGKIYFISKEGKKIYKKKD